MLDEAELVERSRIIMEKPFGTDLASAQKLNAALHEVFDEEQIFRIDHFLGKEAAQNILAFRFANGLFEPIWNRNHIDHVQIDVPETLALGAARRASTRRPAPTATWSSPTCSRCSPSWRWSRRPRSSRGAISEEKNKVFRSMQPIEPADVVRGQYDGYRDEPGVAPDSETETFIALQVRDRQLALGRRAVLPAHRQAAWPRARGSSRSPSASRRGACSRRAPASAQHGPDHLTFDLADASRMSLSFYGKRPGPGMKLDKLSMQFAMHETGWAGDVLEAYERLIYDAMSGDHTLFTTRRGHRAAVGAVAARCSRTRRRCGPTRRARGARTRSTSSIAPARLAAAVRAGVARPQRVRRLTRGPLHPPR